jgi:putative phage-type endonuclease
MEQHSDEWFAARLGKVTASRVADLMAVTKSGYSTSRANYMAELICERLTGQSEERYTNAAMQWGTDKEPQARASYEFLHDAIVVECGFVVHPSIAMFGASPDGLIGNDGLIEIKCPNTATHIDFMLGDSIPSKYVLQMQTQMACTGRKWCDFVSFDPRLPEDMQMFVKRILFDQQTVNDIQAATIKFLDDLDQRISQLRSRVS